MPTSGPCRRLAAALLAVCLLPSVTHAQEPTAIAALQPSLRIPTVAASSAAALDWVTTYHALTNYQVRETNPLLRPWYDSPSQLIGVGALMDIGGITAWNLTVGPRHPRVAVAGLWAMAAFRSYLAVHNLRNEHRAARR
jgi:hypothetical protein